MKILNWLRNAWSEFMGGLRASMGADDSSGGNPDDGLQSSGTRVPRVPIRPQRSGAATSPVPVLERDHEVRES